jgi:energy-coupling factor transport system substrate-specific component
MLMLGGTIVGFLAALLTVMEKLLDIQHRVQAKKEKKASYQPERAVADTVSSVDFFSSKPLRGSSYLLLNETSVIVAAGVLLNYVGLTLSRHLESILFLDMTGTALVAILLGPWWGAIVALLSNSVVNWLREPTW